jgi:hypothetical protein
MGVEVFDTPARLDLISDLLEPLTTSDFTSFSLSHYGHKMENPICGISSAPWISIR